MSPRAWEPGLRFDTIRLARVATTQAEQGG